MTALRKALDALDEARMSAWSAGDGDAADRLAHLGSLVEREREYAELTDRGHPVVGRRTDAPAGYTIGWLLRYCAATRQARRVLGVQVPEVGA